MPVVTLQLGQCGNQLGHSFFQAMGQEFADVDYGRSAVEEWFRPLQGTGKDGDRYVARSVQIDMEPKVVNACRSAASGSGGWWRYPPRGFLTMSSGAGNNWAHGFSGYGPRVRDATLEMVRREAEACDVLGGFALLQSMAGGTGAGLGTYVAEALRDEYRSAHVVNACVWPYESGEVIVQSYNTLLTLSHLNDVSDGLVLISNEALHSMCTKVYNIPRPSFNDMNGIAARAMANLLLPSTKRATGGVPSRDSPGASAGAPRSRPGSGSARAGAASPTWQNAPSGSDGVCGVAAPPSEPHRLLSDMVTQLCCHPHYRLLSLRSIPQMPSASADFTTFSWAAMLKRLRQMHVTGSVMEEGMDWGISLDGGPAMPQSVNRAVASWLVLRGHASADVCASAFADAALFPRWALSPLSVSSNPNRFNKYMMSAASLSNDRAALGPIQRMTARAYDMLASRAFVHQYEAYGLGVDDFRACFAHVEELAARYELL